MKISSIGIELIKRYEGCYLEAYKCPAGIWTIGYGHTKNVRAGMKITKVEAEQMLKEDLGTYEAKVEKYNKKYAWNQNEFDALVSFAFNIGSINQLTAFGTRTKDVIKDKMLLYTKANGKVLKGLVRRRKEECALFTKPITCSVEPQPEMLENVYYPKSSNNVGSLVDALIAIGVDSSYSYRKKIAAANNIKGYKGTEDQNIKLYSLLKAGQLRKV